MTGSSKVTIALNVYGSSDQIPYRQFIFISCELRLLSSSEFTSRIELLVLLMIF